MPDLRLKTINEHYTPHYAISRLNCYNFYIDFYSRNATRYNSIETRPLIEHTYKIRSDEEGSCERNLCECDLAFALDMTDKVRPATLEELESSANAKSNGFKADEQCQVQGNSFSKGFQRAHHTLSVSDNVCIFLN